MSVSKLVANVVKTVETYKSNTASDDETKSRAGHARGAASEGESRLGGHGAGVGGSSSAGWVVSRGSGAVWGDVGCRGGSGKRNDGDDGELHLDDGGVDVCLCGVCRETCQGRRWMSSGSIRELDVLDDDFHGSTGQRLLYRASVAGQITHVRYLDQTRHPPAHVRRPRKKQKRYPHPSPFLVRPAPTTHPPGTSQRGKTSTRQLALSLAAVRGRGRW